MKMMKKDKKSDLCRFGIDFMCIAVWWNRYDCTGGKGKTDNGFTYEDHGYGIVITGYRGSKTELVIPEKIAGKK